MQSAGQQPGRGVACEVDRARQMQPSRMGRRNTVSKHAQAVSNPCLQELMSPLKLHVAWVWDSEEIGVIQASYCPVPLKF